MSERYHVFVSKSKYESQNLDEIELPQGFLGYVANSPNDLETWLSQIYLPPAYFIGHYNNQVGLRNSIGKTDQGSFEINDADAIWVPLDDNGNPMVEATPLKTSQLTESEEYEMISTPISLGLKAIRAPFSEKELRRKCIT